MQVGDKVTLWDLERAQVVAILKDCGGNKLHTAKILGIHRSTLYARMGTHDIKPEEYQTSQLSSIAVPEQPMAPTPSEDDWVR